MSQHLDVSSVSLKPHWNSAEIASPSWRISKQSGNFLTGALMNRSEPLEKDLCIITLHRCAKVKLKYPVCEHRQCVLMILVQR